MEIVSKQARKLLQAMMKVRNDRDYVIYKDNQRLFEKDETATIELRNLKLIKEDYLGNFRITSEGLIYLRQYKTFIRQAWATSFWIPLAVSVIGTTITLIIENYLFKK